jgi:hypothetical protein
VLAIGPKGRCAEFDQALGSKMVRGSWRVLVRKSAQFPQVVMQVSEQLQLWFVANGMPSQWPRCREAQPSPSAVGCFGGEDDQLAVILRCDANQEMALELIYNIVSIVFYSRHPTQHAP